MVSRDEIRSMIGAEAYDRGSNMIGRVAEVYVDEGTPGRRIQLAVDRAQVDDAPPPDEPLPAGYVQQRRRHYHGDDAMTRSEQRMRVGTEWRPDRREKVRLEEGTRFLPIRTIATVDEQLSKERIELERSGRPDGEHR